MLRALYERGIVPDLLVATSVGAVNAAVLASRLPNVATADEFAGDWCGLRRAALVWCRDCGRLGERCDSGEGRAPRDQQPGRDERGIYAAADRRGTSAERPRCSW